MTINGFIASASGCHCKADVSFGEMLFFLGYLQLQDIFIVCFFAIKQ